MLIVDDYISKVNARCVCCWQAPCRCHETWWRWPAPFYPEPYPIGDTDTTTTIVVTGGSADDDGAEPTGWRCPSCRTIYAPHVDSCGACS